MTRACHHPVTVKKRVKKRGTEAKPRYEEDITAREAWAEIDLDDTWTAAYRLVEREGQLVIAEIRVFPTVGENDRAFARWDGTRPLRRRALGEWSGTSQDVPDGGLPAAVHREVVLLDALERAYRQAEEAGSMLPPEIGTIAGSRVEPRGGKRRDPDLLARVAILYDKADRASDRKPIQYIQKHLPGYSASNVRKIVQEARYIGFLTPAPRPGVSGGRATAAAYRALGLTPPP